MKGSPKRADSRKMRADLPLSGCPPGRIHGQDGTDRSCRAAAEPVGASGGGSAGRLGPRRVAGLVGDPIRFGPAVGRDAARRQRRSRRRRHHQPSGARAGVASTRTPAAMARRGREQQLLPVAPGAGESGTGRSARADHAADGRRRPDPAPDGAAAAVTPDAHQRGHRRRRRIVFHHGRDGPRDRGRSNHDLGERHGQPRRRRRGVPGPALVPRRRGHARRVQPLLLDPEPQRGASLRQGQLLPAVPTAVDQQHLHRAGSQPVHHLGGRGRSGARIDRRLRRDYLRPEHRRRARHVHGRWRNAFPRGPCGGGRLGPRPGVVSGRGRYRRLLRPVPAHRQPDRPGGDRRDRLPPARRDGGAEGLPDGAAQPVHGAG